jgi:hypothetical protein
VIAFDTVNGAALAVLPAVLKRLIPGGKILGHEYVALNPTRNDRRPGSFKINIRTGRWADFARRPRWRPCLAIRLCRELFAKRRGHLARANARPGR